MKREDISFYAGIVTAVVTVIVAPLALYEFLKKASRPELVILLGITAACFLLLTLFFLERRTKVGRRFLRTAIAIVKLAVGFIVQNAVLVMSLVAVCVLLSLLMRRIQDIVISAIATGLLLAIACLALGAVRFLAMTAPRLLGLPARAEERREEPALPRGRRHIDWSSFQPLTEESVREYAPTRAGVYLLWVQHQSEVWECFYVGQSENLQARLLAHLSPSEPIPSTKETTSEYICAFQYVEIQTQHDRAGIEKFLYDRYSPECNEKDPGGYPVPVNLP